VLTLGPTPWTPDASPLRGAGGAPLTTLRDLLEFAVAGTPNAA